MWKDKAFYLTGVYGDPISNKRGQVWEKIMRIGENMKGGWILMVDFSEILSNDEKRG